MTLPAWPEELPQFAERKSFRLPRDSSAWSFQPDIGEPLGGRKSRDGYHYIRGVYSFTFAQIEAFWTFWDDDLDGGTGKFTFPHPWTRDEITVRFADVTRPPEFALAGFERHEAELHLRILPV